jgi:hypothetical protein
VRAATTINLGEMRMNKGLLAVLVGLSVSGSAFAGTAPAPAGWQSNPLLCPAVKDFVEQSKALKDARAKLEAADTAEKALDKALAEAKDAEVAMDKVLKDNPTSDAVKAAETATDVALKAVAAAELESDKKLKEASEAVKAAEKEKAADRKEMIAAIVAFRVRANARANLMKEGRQFRKAQTEYRAAQKKLFAASISYYVKCTDKKDSK